MYSAKFTQEAIDQLAELNKVNAQQVLKKLRWLTENFEQATPQPFDRHTQGDIQTARWKLSRA